MINPTIRKLVLFLEACQTPTVKSQISRKTLMDSYYLNEYLQLMIDLEFVVQIENKIVTTETGDHVVKLFKRFTDVS